MNDAIVRSNSAESVVELSKNLVGMQDLAKVLFQSGMFPEINNPYQALVKVEYGREIGLQPIQAMQEIFVIKGHLSISARLMLALFLAGGGRHKVIQKDLKGVKIEFSKEGQDAMTETYLWEEVVKAGNQNKDNYRNYPIEMMWARCIARGVKSYDPGVALGLMAREEAEDAEPVGPTMQPATIEVVAAVKPALPAPKAEATPAPEPPKSDPTPAVEPPKAAVVPPPPPNPAEPEKPKAKPGRPKATRPTSAPSTYPASESQKPTEREPGDDEEADAPAEAEAKPQDMIQPLMLRIEKEYGRSYKDDLLPKVMGAVEKKYKIQITNFPSELTDDQAFWVLSLLDNTVKQEAKAKEGKS